MVIQSGNQPKRIRWWWIAALVLLISRVYEIVTYPLKHSLSAGSTTPSTITQKLSARPVEPQLDGTRTFPETIEETTDASFHTFINDTLDEDNDENRTDDSNNQSHGFYNQSNFPGTEIPQGPYVLHNAEHGLGHRLHRYASAFHLAKTLNVSYQVNWGTCDGNFSIFPYLFGPKPILEVPPTDASTVPSKELRCRNDIFGYYPGEAYQRTGTPVSPKALLEKMKSDEEAYALLQQRFRHDLPPTHTNVTRIGIHIRAGNGEFDRSKWSNRAVDETPERLSHELIQRLQQILEQMVYPRNLPPPMVFVATDTPSWIPILRNELDSIRVPMWTLEQERIPEGSGVYFVENQQVDCLKRWKSMMMDMLLLSQSNILIAGTRSTFTEGLPMSLVMKRGGSFCETARDASAMTCCSSPKAFLFQRSEGCTSVANHTTNATPVQNKVSRQFPDPASDDHLEEARKFFDGASSKPFKRFGSNTGTNYKYRRMDSAGTLGQWVFLNTTGEGVLTGVESGTEESRAL